MISSLGNFSRFVTISCLFTSSCAQNLRFSDGSMILVHRDDLTASHPDFVQGSEPAHFGTEESTGLLFQRNWGLSEKKWCLQRVWESCFQTCSLGK
jgi:hypothetical protein